MVKKRQYVAFFFRTDGTRGVMEFESEYRAGSRENFNDFLRTYRYRYSISASRYIEKDSVEISRC